MPATRPRASFEPISPHFDLEALIEENENFEYAARISVDKIQEEGLELFEKLVLLHVIQGGKPLVIDGFDSLLDPWLFTTKWLNDNHGAKQENARNLTKNDNIPLTISHYLKNMAKLTDQFFDSERNYKDKGRQRVYLKDIDCPQAWQDKLREHIPQSLFYWNDGTGELGGPGAMDENVPGVGRRKGKGAAPSGDLMSSLPQEMRADNLMCYIGHEGTYTPAHKEMCASLGHNIMVNASEAFDEDGQPEKPGSSIWFMTESKDRHTVSEYWLSVLGHDIEVEKHFAQVVAWQRAPFKVYVVEQRAGDFILIPPLAPHQVWNRGTRTMKVAWNRTTVETLEMAMHEALPNARMVCRDEQYKNKAIIYYTLMKYSNLLRQTRMLSSRSARERDAIAMSKKVRQVQKDFRRLFDLFKEIMLSECFGPGSKEQPEYLAFDSNVTCAYCRGNIFNRFLTCKTCADYYNTGVDEPYDVCMDCFAMGRSCACQSKYRWTEQWRWKDLLARYEEWRRQIIELDGGQTGKSPLPLDEERKLQPKKTLAHVCQEQLKVRPWVNIKQAEKDFEEDKSDEEIIVNEDGTVKRTKKKPAKDTKNCHSCCKRHPKWMMVECTMCERGWCYGVLWRGYDLNPLSVMEDIRWECPHCQRICSVGACRKDPRQQPYEPKGTLLGHDTKAVADGRSIECLVDFSKANLNFLGENSNGALNDLRLQRIQWEAEMARQDDDGTLDHDRYAEDDGQVHYEEDVIDPALGGGSNSEWQANQTTFGDSAMENGHSLGGADAQSSVYPEHPTHDLGDTSAMDVLPQDENAGLQPVFSKKRQRPDGPQIKLVSSKKRKTTDDDRPQPKNKANKQYMLAHENKRLEQARKDGRFIQVLASIKGRKRIVKLKIDGEKLRHIIAQPTLGSRRVPVPPSPGQNILIQSDIPAPSAIMRKDTTLVGPRSSKKVRIRVDDDQDFRGDRRRKATKEMQYEEIDIGSDESEVDEDTTGGQKQQSRRSAWRSRKHDGEDDLPDELPENFKDGSVNPRQREREKERAKERAERRQTMPAAMKAPRIRPAMRASTGGLDSTAELPGSGKKRGRPSKADIEAHAVKIARAAMTQEENRQAKLLAAGIEDEGNNSSAEEGYVAASNGFTAVNGNSNNATPTIVRKSILNKRIGPGGRKVKIVARKKAPEPIEVSDEKSSDSEGNIPSNMPKRKGPPGRRTLPDIEV